MDDAAVSSTRRHGLPADAHGATVAILNPHGAAPYVVNCDHASAAIPHAYGGLGLDSASLGRHIAWDIGAAEVVRRLSASLDAAAVLAGVSRLVIDCNRALGSATSIVAESDGVAVPGNADVEAAEAARRAEHYFWPYHRAVDAAIEAVFKRGAVPALIAVHSFTPEMGGRARPWHIGILWNRDTRLARPLIDLLAAESGVVVGENEPYSGHEDAGFSMHHHGGCRGIPNVLIEVRQDLIATAAGVERWASVLERVLGRLLAETAPFRVEQT
jgi:predicted N-formylglutamate amidohydrolase